eukprot:403353829
MKGNTDILPNQLKEIKEFQKQLENLSKENNSETLSSLLIKLDKLIVSEFRINPILQKNSGSQKKNFKIMIKFQTNFCLEKKLTDNNQQFISKSSHSSEIMMFEQSEKKNYKDRCERMKILVFSEIGTVMGTLSIQEYRKVKNLQDELIQIPKEPRGKTYIVKQKFGNWIYDQSQIYVEEVKEDLRLNSEEEKRLLNSQKNPKKKVNRKPQFTQMKVEELARQNVQRSQLPLENAYIREGIYTVPLRVNLNGLIGNFDLVNGNDQQQIDLEINYLEPNHPRIPIFKCCYAQCQFLQEIYLITPAWVKYAIKVLYIGAIIYFAIVLIASLISK